MVRVPAGQVGRAVEAWLVALTVSRAQEPPRLQPLVVFSCLEVRKEGKDLWVSPAAEQGLLRRRGAGACPWQLGI